MDGVWREMHEDDPHGCMCDPMGIHDPGMALGAEYTRA